MADLTKISDIELSDRREHPERFSLSKTTGEVEEIRYEAYKETIRRDRAIPADRSARELIGGGDPNSDEHRKINPQTGQQRDYVVLSAEERAKGFVRPVRDKYLHVGSIAKGVDYRVITPEMAREIRANGGCATHTSMSREIAETYARDNKFYDATFCSSCRKHFPLDQFVWLGTSEQVGS